MNQIHERLQAGAARAQRDREFQVATRRLPVPIAMQSGNDPASRIAIHQPDTPLQEAGILLSAPGNCWEHFLAAAPPPNFQSFTAAMRFVDVFEVIGEPLHIAQALHALERFFEILRGQIDTPHHHIDRSAIQGRYIKVPLNGEPTTLYVEESGVGAPLVMLHTAGADSRQYHGLMADSALQSRWRMIAFDMPGHGRSPPSPGGAWTAPLLQRDYYLSICNAVIQHCARARSVLLGCSMGAAMALYTAARNPENVAGVVALEAPWKATGRLSPMLCNPQVNQAAHNPAYVRGLMAPQSPLGMRREAAWIYSQGGFGMYEADLHFYSEDFDAPVHLAGLDTSQFEVSLFTGAYDYSARPEDSQRVAALIPGARYTTMPDMGHFPMIENPWRLLDYLRPELQRMEPQR
ncbi:alpha/beta fold hydrolase (plasmid) [Diaphorobacter sp. HDW4B]|uniref:alpha/beta fold hydrolase n=1 Tax=Diaphorobacter sp. HDW4B TaxID=2714925 RepID=UPI0014077CDA|nr:alpha/beta hydrolase [Diaphorobacter sp. HDW4B]QIL74169.1 alpha/beta fold hydrolase [Diaphorobacter sp. HDW4B]